MSGDFVGSELSDTEIMAQTTVERQAASGRLALSFKLPSGKEAVGTIPESGKAQGIIRWCATVNEAIRAEKAEERAKQRRAAALARAPIAVVGSTSATHAPTPQITGMPSDTSAVQSLSSDPNAFVLESLHEAQATRNQLFKQRLAVMAAHDLAEENVRRWIKVAESLGLKWDNGPSEETIKKA